MNSEEIKNKVRNAQEQISKGGVDAEFLISQRGVPYIKINKKGVRFNVCYFANQSTFKVFKKGIPTCDICTEEGLYDFIVGNKILRVSNPDFENVILKELEDYGAPPNITSILEEYLLESGNIYSLIEIANRFNI